MCSASLIRRRRQRAVWLENQKRLSPSGFSPTNAVLIAWRAAVLGAGHPDPSSAWLQSTDTFLNALAASGDLAKMDALYLAGEDATHVVRDCIDPTRVGVLQLAPTYTPLEGVTFNGTSQYMQSGFNPADDADNMTPTSFSFGVYERVTSEAFTGHGAGSDGSFRLLPFFNTDTARAYLNSGASTFKDCGGSSGLGLTVLQRNGSANNIYQNGSALSEEIAPTLESDDFASIEVLIGALPGPSGYRSCQVPAAFLADGTLDQSAVATELEAYLDALGVGVIA